MLAMDAISTPCQSDGKCPSILIDCDAQSTFYEYAQRLQDRAMYQMISQSQVYVLAITSSGSWPKLVFALLTVWVSGLLLRQYLRLTPSITKKVMSRTANVAVPKIKRICHFFISSSFSRLFSPDSLSFDEVFRSIVTVNEKTTNFLTSAFCDAGVAVILTCVTMPRGVLGSDERINRNEVVC